MINHTSRDNSGRYLKLANGLKVLVVSDATTEKAAAALSVRVGESHINIHVMIK